MKRNLKIGIKLLIASLLVALATIAPETMQLQIMVLAGIVLSMPTRWKYFHTSKLYEGDDDEDEDENEVKVVMKKLETRTRQILKEKGFVDKSTLEKELETRMAKFKDLSEEDFKLLKLWTEEGDKGIRSMLKKQGEEITAIKELATASKKELPGLRGAIEKKMEDIKKLYASKNPNTEIRLDVRAAAVMTLQNTIEGDELLPDELIESFSVSNFVEKRQQREYVFDMAYRRTVAKITQFKTWLEEGDIEGAFAIVAEGGLKPLISMTLVRNHTEYKKIAAKYVVTEEFAKFRTDAYTIIQRLIRNKLMRDYQALLTTDLIADAAPYVSSALDDEYADPTDYHAIAAVAAQIEALGFAPDLLIMNPQDSWRIRMAQDSSGAFVLQVPITDAEGQTRILGFAVRTSARVPVGSFVLGESGLWEIEDEPITVRMGYGINVTTAVIGTSGAQGVTAVESDLDHNRFRVIVETYFHNFIASNNQGSFVSATFDAVKALLLAP